MKRRKAVSRRRRSPAVRLVRFWIAFAAIFVVAIVCAYLAATWSGFDPRSIAVSGNVVVSKNAILQAAAIPTDRDIWLQNVRAARARIESIPYVDRAWIHRRPPANVGIVVTERVPVAVVQSGAVRGLVDGDLRVLETDPPATTLPVLVPARPLLLSPGTFIKDAQITALRSDLSALEAARIPVTRLTFDSYGELSAQLKSGVTILLGEADFAKKVPLIEPILTQLAHKRPFRAIDLRALDAPVVVYK